MLHQFLGVVSLLQSQSPSSSITPVPQEYPASLSTSPCWCRSPLPLLSISSLDTAEVNHHSHFFVVLCWCCVWVITLTQIHTLTHSAQGMPKDIEKLLTKCITSFMWDNTGCSTIPAEILQAPVYMGGKNLLNLKHRNDAIELTWLKKLLAPPTQHHTWTYFAHALLAIHAGPSPVSHPNARLNFFLQMWPVQTSCLPPPIRRLMKVAKKFNLTLDGPSFSKETCNSLPAWFHIDSPPRLRSLNNYFYSCCLRDNHHVRLVSDVLSLANLPTEVAHKNAGSCTCITCSHLWATASYVKPFKCLQTARDISANLPHKWHPETAPHPSNATALMPQIMLNKSALLEKKALTFAPIITHSGPIEVALRIIHPSTDPCMAWENTGNHLDGGYTIAYCASTSHVSADDGYILCGGVWFSDENPKNVSFRTERNDTSPDSGALGALLITVRLLPPGQALHLHLSSTTILRNLTVNLQLNEDLDWILTRDGTLYHVLVCALKTHTSMTLFQQWSEESPQPEWIAAIALASKALVAPSHTTLDEYLDSNHAVQGMSLSAGSQKTFHKALMVTSLGKEQHIHMKTKVNLTLTQYAAQGLWNFTPTYDKIWLSVRDRGILKAIHSFLWKCLHGWLQNRQLLDKDT